MSFIQKSIVVQVPRQTVYNQWTQFEEFPLFMEGIESVEQLDDRHLRWKARLGGKAVAWTAEICDQVPDQRIGWRSTSGAKHHGLVQFESTGPHSTRVSLEVEFDPTGMVESVGEALGVVSRRVESDLRRFREFIESRGVETGAWRGQIAECEPMPTDESRPPPAF